MHPDKKNFLDNIQSLYIIRLSLYLLQWPEDERWELIDGVPYNMSPAPSRRYCSGKLQY